MSFQLAHEIRSQLFNDISRAALVTNTHRMRVVAVNRERERETLGTMLYDNVSIGTRLLRQRLTVCKDALVKSVEYIT